MSPVVINAQNKLNKKLESNGNIIQPHFERLKAELGKYPNIEDLFFLQLKVEIDSIRFTNTENDIKDEQKTSEKLFSKLGKMMKKYLL